MWPPDPWTRFTWLWLELGAAVWDDQRGFAMRWLARRRYWLGVDV